MPLSSIPSNSLTSNSVNSLTAPVTNIASTVLPQNEDRISFSIWNSGANAALLDFENDPTETSYSFRLEPGQLYEPPVGLVYSGTVKAVALSGNTTLHLREFVA